MEETQGAAPAGREHLLHVQLAAPLEVCAAALTALRVSCDRAFGGRKGASCGPARKAESFHPRRLSHACPGRAAASEVLYSSAHMRFLVPASRADASWDSLSAVHILTCVHSWQCSPTDQSRPSSGPEHGVLGSNSGQHDPGRFWVRTSNP